MEESTTTKPVVGEQVQQPKGGKVSHLQLFKYSERFERITMLVATLMSVAQGMMMPLFSVVYGQVAEDFTPTSPPEVIKSKGTITASYMLYIGLGTFFFCFMGTFLWSYTGAKLAIRVKKLYFNSITGQEMGWFDVVNSERLTLNYVEDTTKFKDAVGFKNHLLVYSTGTALLGFAVGFYQGWWFALIVTLIFPLIMIGMVMFVIISQREARLSKAAYEESGACSEQCLGAIKTVKSLVGEEHELNSYKLALAEATKISTKYGLIAALTYGFFMLCLVSNYGLNYWIGSVLVDRQVTNTNQNKPYGLADILTVFFAIVNGGFALGQTAPSLKALALGKEAAHSIYQIIERKSLIPLDDPQGIVPATIQGEIEFCDVKFNYPSRKEVPVLRGVSLTIPKGKKVALVGETGCGKSTSIQLIERYYDPDFGTIKIDGKDIREYKLSALRQHIGYVGQEPVLFAMTIRENLQIAKPGATEEEMKEALSQANAWTFIQELEAGLDTFVGAGGNQMSGGQKQRICIARSILQNPKILLLDEATSALDRKNEKEIQETLDRFSSDRTTVTIAHRLSTIINSDLIYAFQKGQVVEKGSHEELLRMNGYYAKLVQIQLHGLEMVGAQDEAPEGMQEPLDEQEGITPRKQVKVSHNPENQGTARGEMRRDQPEEDNMLLSARNQTAVQPVPQPFAASTEKKKQIKNKLMQYLNGQYLLFGSGCASALLSGCVFPVFALLVADMLTVLSKYEVLRAGYGKRFGYTWEDTREESVQLALGFVYISIFALVSNFVQLGFFNALAVKVTSKIRADLYKHFITRDMAFFDKRENNPGELSSVLSKDCLVVNSVVSTSYGAILTGIGAFTCGIIIAFVASWRIALIGVAGSPFIFAAGVLKTRFIKGKTNNKRDDTEEFKIFQETCTNMKTVMALNAFKGIRNTFDTKMTVENTLSHKANAEHAALESFAQFIQFVIYSLTFFAGADFTVRYGLTFNDLYRSFMAVMLASFGASMGQQFVSNIAEAEESAARIFEFFSVESKIQNVQNPLKTPIKGEIEFRNVKFRYPERTAVCFENLSFKIQPKQKAAFAGPSGTGKSTIFSLLYRFYDPDEGEILVDGVNIKQYDIQHLRKSLGMVSQEPTLFNMTIEENIRYNQEGVQMPEIRQAALISNAMKFIEGDERQEIESQDGQGFSRKVGLKGGKLSGGQKQRVAIARTVVRKPAIYMFDEATSALDT